MILKMNLRNVLIYIAFVLGAWGIMWSTGFDPMAMLGMDPDAGHRWERQAIMGTWAEESGNGIASFIQVEGPGSNAVVKVLEGRYRITDSLGLNGAQGIWNYGATYPLRLNIVADRNGYVLAVKFLDHDHVRMSLYRDPNQGMQPGAADSPDAKVFRRVTQ